MNLLYISILFKKKNYVWKNNTLNFYFNQKEKFNLLINKKYSSNLIISNLLNQDFNIQQIKENTGAIWISKTYIHSRYINILRIFYKIIGKEQNLLYKLHKEIDESFDNLQFPGLRQIIPNFKENGCYVTFASKEQAKKVLQELHGIVEVGGIPKKAFLVQGKPFIEDLLNLKPSQKIVIELLGASQSYQKLSQEWIFSEFRPYGRMKEIVLDAKKETAFIIFSSVNSAISARNCLHLKTVGDTKFYIRYEPFSRWHIFLDIIKNPKFLIPILGIAISLSTYLLVSPMRVASVTQKLTRGYKDEKNPEEVSKASLREDLTNLLKKQLFYHPDGTVTIITGPSGTGKTLLLKKLIHRRAFTIRINCVGINSVQEFIESFGDNIGFSPSFNALNTILNWVEGFIPGLKKTALSPSAQIQLKSMLQSLDNVFYLVSASYPSKDKEWDYIVMVFDGFHELIETFEKQTQTEKEKARQLLDILLEWVAKNSKIGHMIFIGESTFGEDILIQSNHLKKVKISKIYMPDLTLKETVSYLGNQMRLEAEEIIYAISKIGGRVADIETLIARVSAGLELREATDIMISEAEQYIRNEGFGGKLLTAPTGKAWTQAQLWKTIRILVEKKKVPFDELLFLVFYGDIEAIKALCTEKILSIHKENEKKFIVAFSPLFQSAFEKIVHESPYLRKSMDILAKKADINKDMEDLNKIEEELIKLTKGEKISLEVDAQENRRKLLSEKMLIINQKLEKKEKELREIENQQIK